MRNYFWFVIVLFVIFSFAAFGKTEKFPRPESLLPNIAFWTNVYGKWTTEDIAFSDESDLSMVYRVIQVPPIGQRRDGMTRDQMIRQTRSEIIATLKTLDLIKPQSEHEVSGLALEIFRSLKEVKRVDKYQRGDFIRAQNGLSNRFERGYQLSGAHDQEIKARLKREGLPEELIAIVFVESLFYSSSISHAGAAGIWQFMRRTAKEFMRINPLVDERYDPLIATESAIQYLKGAYAKLESWPLAITSYNHGRAGMMRAVKSVNSRDIADILKYYQSPSFQFASRNYYAEFLAALDVYNNAEQIFAKVKPVPDWAYDVIELSKPVFVQDLVNNRLIDKEWLVQYNPALTANACAGKEVIPQGFKIRIPEGQKEQFNKKFILLSGKQFDRASDQVRAKYRANGRQRVFDIAKTYDVFHDQLAKRLGYAPNQIPRRGSVILVRSADSLFTQIPSPIKDAYQLAESKKDNSREVTP
jgi:membrane-bound lytic murein transglycosylase D